MAGTTTKDNNFSHVIKLVMSQRGSKKKSISNRWYQRMSVCTEYSSKWPPFCMSQMRVFCISDNFIISPFATSRLHTSLQLYSTLQNPTHLNAHSIVTIHTQAIFDTACFTQNNSCHNNLEFGRSHAGHSV